MNINRWLKSIGRDPSTVDLDCLGLLSQLSQHYERMMQPTLFDTPKADNFIEEIRGGDTLVEVINGDDDRLDRILDESRDTPSASEYDRLEQALEEAANSPLSSEYERELELLRQELEQDIKDGILLVGEPFEVDSDMLRINRHQEAVKTNMPFIVKSVVDKKYHQDIASERVNFACQEMDGALVISNITCVNKFGVRFPVKPTEVIEILSKIDFE